MKKQTVDNINPPQFCDERWHGGYNWQAMLATEPVLILLKGKDFEKIYL